MEETRAIGGAEQVLERLRRLPGGPELLALAQKGHDLALVGGAVRDLLCGVWPRELDVTVAPGSSAELAGALATSIPEHERAAGEPIEPTLHERFGTASLAWTHGRIDIAERRAESYPAPGALPDVRPGTVEEDLARRDFTVNAITIPLAGERRGELIAVEHALEDLAAGRLRVLHERSFGDDPTRVLRLARYQARLDLEIETSTLELARSAVSGGALQSVSGARIASELWLFTEESNTDGFAALGELGVLAAIGLPARFDEPLHQQASGLMPQDGIHEALDMTVLFHPPAGEGPPTREQAEALMESFEFFAELRARVLAGAFGVDALAARIEARMSPSELRGLLAGRPVEGLAIVGALAARRSAAAGEAVGRWLAELRHVRLEIDGEELLAAGVAEGPEVGLRLERALELRLDGRLQPGREAELRAALEADL
jgi:tRNA nucleotidyltransferase (CCA-adding enzyme)